METISSWTKAGLVAGVLYACFIVSNVFTVQSMGVPTDHGLVMAQLRFQHAFVKTNEAERRISQEQNLTIAQRQAELQPLLAEAHASLSNADDWRVASIDERERQQRMLDSTNLLSLCVAGLYVAFFFAIRASKKGLKPQPVAS